MKFYQIKKRILTSIVLLLLLTTIYYITPTSETPSSPTTDFEKLYKGNKQTKPEKQTVAQSQLGRELSTLREKERLRELMEKAVSPGLSDLTTPDLPVDAPILSSKQSAKAKQLVQPPNLLQPYKDAPAALPDPAPAVPVMKATKATALGKIKAIPINVKDVTLDLGDSPPLQRKPAESGKLGKGVGSLEGPVTPTEDEGTAALDINGKPIIAAPVVAAVEKLKPSVLGKGLAVAAIDPVVVGSKRSARISENLNMTAALDPTDLIAKNVTAGVSLAVTTADLPSIDRSKATATIPLARFPVPQVISNQGESITD